MSQRRLTKAEASDRLGISLKQLERYVAQGIPCTGAARRFPWPEIRAWRDKLLVRQGEERAESKAEPKKENTLESRHDEAKTRLLELELEETEGKLIRLDVHEERVRALCEPLAARCKGLGKYLGDVQLATTDVEAAALLERMSDDLLRSLVATADDIEEEGGDASNDPPLGPTL